MALYDYSSPDTPTAGDPVADEEVLSDEHLSGSQPSDRNPERGARNVIQPSLCEESN